MGSWSVQLKVGLVVIIGIVLLVILIVNAANSPWGVSGELLRVSFNNAGDLRVGAKVQLAVCRSAKLRVLNSIRMGPVLRFRCGSGMLFKGCAKVV